MFLFTLFFPLNLLTTPSARVPQTSSRGPSGSLVALFSVNPSQAASHLTPHSLRFFLLCTYTPSSSTPWVHTPDPPRPLPYTTPQVITQITNFMWKIHVYIILHLQSLKLYTKPLKSYRAEGPLCTTAVCTLNALTTSKSFTKESHKTFCRKGNSEIYLNLTII